jgi:hypothetical protein
MKLRNKLQDEFNKIKVLDKQLASSNIVYKGMKEKAKVREKKIAERIYNEKEKKKKSVKNKDYIRAGLKRQGSSRGSSRSKVSAKSRGNKTAKGKIKRQSSAKKFSIDPFTGMRKRPMSGRKGPNRSAKKSKEDDGSTFLTAVQHPEKIKQIDRAIKDELNMDIEGEGDGNQNNDIGKYIYII